jgi:hypothetical protein
MGQYIPSRFADLPHNINRTNINIDERIINNRTKEEKNYAYNAKKLSLTSYNPHYRANRWHTDRIPYISRHRSAPRSDTHTAITISLEEL